MKPANTAAPKMRAIRTKVKVQQLPHGHGLALPAYQSAGAAGVDLVAALNEGETITLKPGQRALIPTGLALEIPFGFEAQIRPRSGLALRHGVSVLNSPGTIDSDYRGEVKVLLINLGEKKFTVTRGARIAQMVLAPVCQANLVNVVTLSSSQRGTDGFGSTGGGTAAAPARSRKAAPTLAPAAPKRAAAKSAPKSKSISKPKPKLKSKNKPANKQGSKSAPKVGALSKGRAAPTKTPRRSQAGKKKSTRSRTGARK